MVDILKNITGQPLIRAVMTANKVTNASIAKQKKVTPEYVSNVVTGKRTGYRIRMAIAARCHVPVEYLWPDTPEEYRRAA